MVRHFGFVLLAIFLASQAHAQNAPSGGIQQTHDYVPGEVLVKLKSSTGESESRAFLQKTAAQKGLQLKRSWRGLNMHKLSYNKPEGGPELDVPALVQQLQSDPDVEYAEPNYKVERMSVGETEVVSESDAQAESTITAQSYTQTGAPIDVQQTWPVLSSGNTPPVVAIIDTGLDYTHHVFADSGAVWTNTGEVPGNHIDDDGNGYVDDVHGWNFAYNTNDPMDDDGHGTHVAGIVLGTSLDIRANPMATAKMRLMPLKFLDSHGSGTTSDAIEAIYYAANNGAKVLNNSWGGGGYSQSLVDAIAYAYGRKVLFVVAAGNASNNNDATPTYPSSYVFPNLISVAASNDWDNLATFSNYGSSSVNLGSPGVAIYSTLPHNTYGYMNGTSMATPFVTGVAAMMLYEKPTMNGYQIKNLIFGTAESVSGMNGKVSTNSRLNSYNAVTAAQSTSVDPYMPAYDSGANVNRFLASEGGSKAAGCGTIAKAVWDKSGSRGPGNPMQQAMAVFGLLFILFAPILLNVYLKSKDPKNRRAYERFHIASEVRVRAGGRELTGAISSISMGGAQINMDALLEQGGIVTMQISSPDGKDVINVDGKVVWSEEQKHYGVQFQNAQESTLAAISRWTQSLMRN